MFTRTRVLATVESHKFPLKPELRTGDEMQKQWAPNVDPETIIEAFFCNARTPSPNSILFAYGS